jgi:hypothetical protein
MQIFDGKDPVPSYSPVGAERHGFEYIHHGAWARCTVLSTHEGDVHGETVARHANQESLHSPL